MPMRQTLVIQLANFQIALKRLLKIKAQIGGLLRTQHKFLLPGLSIKKTFLGRDHTHHGLPRVGNHVRQEKWGPC
ncbi:MAG: hypothetical protein Q7T43_11915 [Rhodoferax sp.]|nr:hypothetical protein [Rhodoferax sp.]